MNIQQYEAKGKKKYKVEGAYIGVDVMTGKQVRTTIKGSSKADVKRKLENKKREFERNGSTVKKKVAVKTVNDLIDVWLETEYKGTNKSNTEKNAIMMIKNKVRPFIGELRLSRLSTAIVQQAMNDYSKSEAFNIELPWRPWTYLNQAFKFGVRMEYIDRNFCENTLRAKGKERGSRTDFKYYSAHEVDLILKGLEDFVKVDIKEPAMFYKNQMFACFIKLQIFTGLRIGESLALEWTDIDFEKGTLEVNKTLTPDAKGTQTPKTKASYRTIQLADDTVKMLEEWKKFQYHKYWNLNQMPPKAIFWHMWTYSYCTQRIICRTLQSFIESINVPYHGGVHVMRHTYATLHLANGTPYHVIQRNLGHADISMTMRVYAHTQEEELKEANNNVINLFSKVGT